MSGQDKLTSRYFLGILVAVLLLWCSSWALVYRLLPDWPTRGTFGDMFGAVNALFSGLALGGVIVAIFLQQKELSLQRRELELTRAELRRSASAQENSQRALKEVAEETRHAAQGNLLNTWLQEYKSSPIREALRVLRELSKDPDFARHWAEKLENRDPEAIKQEEARYLVHGLFSTAARVYRAGGVTQPIVREICLLPGIQIWFEVVEQLNQAKSPDNPYEVFDALRDIWTDSGFDARLGRTPPLA